MAFDIHGNNLEHGCCEVHPWVHESYPCSLCYAESRPDPRLERLQKQQKDEYLADMQHDYYESVITSVSYRYRLILWICNKVDKLNKTIHTHKERLFEELVRKHL